MKTTTTLDYDQTIVNRRSQIRQHLAKGDIEKAGKLALKYGLDIEECKLVSVMDGPPEIMLPEGVEPKRPEKPEPKPWPKKTKVYVYAYPINKRMIVVRLPDKREAFFWRSSNQQYPIGAELKAVLMDTVGTDVAYYELAYE